MVPLSLSLELSLWVSCSWVLFGLTMKCVSCVCVFVVSHAANKGKIGGNSKPHYIHIIFTLHHTSLDITSITIGARRFRSVREKRFTKNRDFFSGNNLLPIHKQKTKYHTTNHTRNDAKYKTCPECIVRFHIYRSVPTRRMNFINVHLGFVFALIMIVVQIYVSTRAKAHCQKLENGGSRQRDHNPHKRSMRGSFYHRRPKRDNQRSEENDGHDLHDAGMEKINSVLITKFNRIYPGKFSIL